MADSTHSLEQAKAQLASIKTMVAGLLLDFDQLETLREERDSYEPADPGDEETSAGPDTWEAANPEDATVLADLQRVAKDFETTTGRELTCADDAREAIEEDPLSIEVRSDWVSLEDWPGEPSQFMILLCTGGPACRIVGELQSGDPSRAWIEHQDWGTPWTELINEPGDQDALLEYARCFCFEVEL